MDPSRKPEDLIGEAMRSREAYDRLAAEEMRIWGKVLPERERAAATEEDRRAAAELRINRGSKTLVAYARENGLKFRSGLSLGCGEGRAERRLLSAGVCDRFHGIDVAEDAIAECRRRAEAKGLPATYEVADLNLVELPEGAYDLVVAQTSLHHLVFLENVVSQIWRSITDGGMLWVHEYVGETQFQYSDARLEIANRVLALLPEKYRVNRYGRPTKKAVRRREPGSLVSPFESIRSGEIKGILLDWFDPVWMSETHSLVQLLVPPGTRASYTESEDSRAIFELIMLLDELCLREGILSPAQGIYALEPRPRRDVEGLLAAIRPPFESPE